MTSKISFFKLRKENMRHHLAVLLLTCFCFLMHILAFVIRIQNLTGDTDLKHSEVMESVAVWAQPGYVQSFFVIVLAVILAMSGLSYLHSRTKTDFYHSLPIKRENLFAVIALNCLLIFALPFLFACLAETAIAGITGFLTVTFVKNVAASILCYFLVFTMSYLTAALAMIMTGNLIVGLLGFCVFAGYAPILVKNIFPCLANVFLDTYVNTMSARDGFDYFSPISLAAWVTSPDSGAGWSMKEHVVPLGVLLVEIVLLLLLCQKLFKIRPSEAAGKAMAFPKLNPIIRIMLVIPMALFSGVFFYSMVMNEYKIWLVIGVAIGAFVFHGLIESIYQFDIHGLLSNKKQMGICMAICFIIVGFFYTDAFGYDKYVPEVDKTGAILVEPQIFSDRADAYWGEERDGVSGQPMEDVMGLLRQKVESLATTNEEYQDFVTVTYVMKNGRKIKRQYTMTLEEENEIMSQMLASKEYKKDLFSLYTADWSKITQIMWDNQIDFITLKLTQEEQEQFLNLYLEELDTLSFKEMTETAPTSEFCVSHENGKMDDYYYIYPSFEKTIAFLKEKGCDADLTIKDMNIVSLDIIQYGDSGRETVYPVTDQAVIASVKDKLNISGFCGNVFHVYNSNNLNVELSAHIVTKYGGSQEVYVSTDDETLKILDDARGNQETEE